MYHPLSNWNSLRDMTENISPFWMDEVLQLLYCFVTVAINSGIHFVGIFNLPSVIAGWNSKGSPNVKCQPLFPLLMYQIITNEIHDSIYPVKSWVLSSAGKSTRMHILNTPTDPKN
jgi:hypothetical protein